MVRKINSFFVKKKKFICQFFLDFVWRKISLIPISPLFSKSAKMILDDQNCERLIIFGLCFDNTNPDLLEIDLSRENSGNHSANLTIKKVNFFIYFFF